MASNQKGVSLIITFLIMTIMIAIVLSLTTVIFNKVKIISNMGSSLSSFYAAHAGIEKTLYFDQKQIPMGATRGFCNICNFCNSNDCSNCVATSLVAGGCNINSCNNCEITYESTFDNRIYKIDATITPNVSNPMTFDLYINSKGFYKDTTRTVEFRATQ